MVFVAVENGFSLYKGMATFGASFLWFDAAEWRVKTFGRGAHAAHKGVGCIGIVEKHLLQRPVFNVNGIILLDMFYFIPIQLLFN